MVARTQHCRSVSTPEPYEVPNELATSFAPMANERRNEMGRDAKTMGRVASELVMIGRWRVSSEQVTQLIRSLSLRRQVTLAR